MSNDDFFGFGYPITPEQKRAFLIKAGLNPDEAERTYQAVFRAVCINTNIYMSLKWLLHLHHGVSKYDGETPKPGEWDEAIEAGMKALADYEKIYCCGNR